MLESYWSPLIFVGAWSSATLVIYSLGADGHPGRRTHLSLCVLSFPLWWWVELVNTRVGNWEYLRPAEYDAFEYAVFASLAFSTVVPALHSAWRLFLRFYKSVELSFRTQRDSLYLTESAVGLISIGLVFVAPDLFFP
jgi:hypothetical protein